MRATWLALLLVLPVLTGCLGGGGEPSSLPGGADGFGGVVASSHPLATQAGTTVLEAGGNAFDAAAATQFALNVVEPYFSGIGGGALMVAYLAETGEIMALDGREQAPTSTTADQFQAYAQDPAHDPTTMGTAVGVPGTLALFAQAVERWGEASLAEALDPAISLAKDGFTVDPELSETIETYEQRLNTWPASAEVFLPGSTCAPTQAGYAVVTSATPRCTGGQALQPGDRLVQADLAGTMEAIQADGPEAFYAGPIAEAIVETVAQREGAMTFEDLAGYEVVERSTVRSAHESPVMGTVELVGMETPSSGVIVQQIVGLVEGLELPATGPSTGTSSHRLLEAMHLAYADRGAYLGDSRHVDVPLEGLLAEAYLDERRALIDPHRANPDPRPGDPWAHQNGTSGAPAEARSPHGAHTSHFVVVDQAGNVVTVTTTVERAFGTGMVVPGYGFVLNNELTDFDHAPGGPNEPGPGKRPLSSMSPTLVLQDGEPVLALGSPGGRTIVATVAQVLVHVLEHGLGLEEAIQAPRLYSSDYPEVLWETGFTASARAEMEARGHQLADAPSKLGGVQAAQRLDAGAWVGVADDRRSGGVAYANLTQPVLPAGVAG